MTGEIRFTRSADGTRIAYTTFGSGPPLIEVPRWAVTIDWVTKDEELAVFYNELAEFRRVTLVERRGTGASQRDAKDIASMATQVGDVLAVADAAGLETFDLFGSGDSAAVCVQLAAETPERVKQLVLWGPYALGFQHLRISQGAESFRNWREMFRTNFALAARLIADDFFPSQPASLQRHIAGLWVDSVPPEIADAYVEFGFSIDVRESLAKVAAPTLVVHRRDHRTGHLVEYAMDVAAGIPDASLVLVDGDVGIHQYQHDKVITELRKFLGDEGPEASAPSGLRTVLFTDLVGHTEMMRRLGDEKGREVLREHESLTRNVLKQHGGTEVKTMGDGFMASFGSVTKAVECAIALQKAFTERNASADELLTVRVGLNAGEPIEDEGDLFGSTVILASRIAAKAGAGEILVTNAVRELCSGKGFLFSDRGEFVAKGFEEPVRTFEVSWAG